MPVAKRPGTQVYAGTVIEEGDCVIEVTQSSGESRYDKIVSMIEQSEQLKSAAESHAANLADKLVPYTLVGSALSYALTRNVTRALSVLMVDFSCALKLAMPLAVLSAMREASMYHITVKGGKFLEAVAQADTIVFDKTGTLTHACRWLPRLFRSVVVPKTTCCALQPAWRSISHTLWRTPLSALRVSAIWRMRRCTRRSSTSWRTASLRPLRGVARLSARHTLCLRTRARSSILTLRSALSPRCRACRRCIWRSMARSSACSASRIRSRPGP